MAEMTAKANKGKRAGDGTTGAVAKNATTAEKKVRGAIQSLPEKIATVLWGIFQLVIQLGVSLQEFAEAFGGKAGENNRLLAAESLRDIVRGVSREVTGLSLDIAQKLGIIEEATDITPPPGGKVFRVLVLVDWVTSWRDYLLACCPQTGEDWTILDVGDQYVSPHRGMTIEEVYLVWFGEKTYRTVEKADKWFEDSGLERAHGRIPAAVIGGIPNLPKQLGKFGYPYGGVGVVSTSSCVQGGGRCIPYAWRDDAGDRGARLFDAGVGWNVSSLFAAVRPSRK